MALARLFPNLTHGIDQTTGDVLDYHVLNRQADGSETIIWMNNEETQPTEQEMQVAYDEAMKDKILDTLNKEVNTYINKHYDTGTQASFTAKYTLDTTSAETKALIVPLWTWINSVMTYYYQRKALLQGDNWETTTWDFTTFDETDPDISLSSFME